MNLPETDGYWLFLVAFLFFRKDNEFWASEYVKRMGRLQSQHSIPNFAK